MIHFDPVKHVYTNTLTNEKYISVSTILGKFKSEFDKENISRFVAQKRGVTQAEILAEWEKTNNDSKVIGTKIHAILEEYAKNGMVEPENEKLVNEFKKMGNYTKKAGTLHEQLVYNHQYKIAGTADIIHPDGKYFDVFDIKTNKKFNFFSGYDKMLKPPLDHFTDCEYNNYSMQLSLYAYLYHLMTGRIVRQLGVFYYDKIAETFQRYPVAYLKNDVINLLNAR